MTGRASLVLASALLLASCTYLQQRQDVMEGGPQRREAEANARLESARTQNQNLRDEQLQLDREIERNSKRIAATQADLDRISAELEAARKRSSISEAEYRRMRGEVSRANRDLNETRMELDTGRVTGNVDVSAKERQIQALEKKKNELEKALTLPPTH